MNKQYLAGTALAGLLAVGGVAAATIPSSASPAATAAKAGLSASAPAAEHPAPGGRHRPPRCPYPVRHADLDLFVSPHHLRHPGRVYLVAHLSKNGRMSCPIAGASISFYKLGRRGDIFVGSEVTGRNGFAVTTAFVRRTTSFYAVGGKARSDVVTARVRHS